MLFFIPSLWKEVTLFPKPGNQCVNRFPRYYRQISLSSFFIKTLKRLLEHEIRSNFNVNITSTSQHAYVNLQVNTTMKNYLYEWHLQRFSSCHIVWLTNSCTHIVKAFSIEIHTIWYRLRSKRNIIILFKSS